MRPAPTCRFVTFGCKVNQYDTQAMRESLMSRGWAEPAGSEADIVIVDTCSVTETAAREALRRIRQAARRPNARVVVSGCMVPTHRADLESIPGVVLLVPPGAKSRLGQAVDALGPSFPGTATPDAGRTSPAAVLPDGDPADVFRLSISRFAGRTRAYIKVQDGCDRACAYCVVPRARGRSRSRPADEAVAEARRLVEAGYRELVLTGIHLGAWGRDLPGHLRLFDLVARLLAIPGRWRLRLSSIEADELREEEIAAFSALAAPGTGGTAPRLCPHLHLPMQSGSADVLRRMRRPYDPAAFERTVASLRKRLPDAAVSTDLIVGFPGETDRDAAETIAAAERLAFSRIHAFPYSPRPGTEASGMPGHVPAEAVRARMRALALVAAASAEAFHRRFVGRDVEVLVEERPDRRTGSPAGYSGEYVRVLLPPGTPRGALVSARIASADAGGASAESGLRPARLASFAV
jgi:threonylcarbamoyladenosine tRNA methylthiotransferase MtaB